MTKLAVLIAAIILTFTFSSYVGQAQTLLSALKTLSTGSDGQTLPTSQHLRQTLHLLHSISQLARTVGSLLLALYAK